MARPSCPGKMGDSASAMLGPCLERSGERSGMMDSTVSERSGRVDLALSVTGEPSTASKPQCSKTRGTDSAGLRHVDTLPVSGQVDHKKPVWLHSNGQSIGMPSTREEWRCLTEPSGSLEYQHGLESTRLLNGADEDDVKDATNDKGEVIQLGREENSEATPEHKLVTKEEDGQGEGDEFDAALTIATWENKPLQKIPVTRPSSLDQAPETPQKRGRGRPPGSKNKPKSTLSHPGKNVVPHAKHGIRKLPENTFKSTSNGQDMSWAGLHPSSEMTPRLVKRCSRNPAPIYNLSYVPKWMNGLDESPEVVVATGAPVVARASSQKPQLAFHSNTGMPGLLKPREDELASEQALPTTELSAHELRPRNGKTKWWYNDGKGKFVYKRQDQPPPRPPKAKYFAASISRL
ncbi:MAG: hypothetical protein Q9182_003661 [Xanthomendoza sp. 2 TL-2023]